MDKYRIVKKYVVGIETFGYYIVKLGDEKAEERLFKVEDVIKLCNNGNIDGASTVIDTETGEYVLVLDEPVVKADNSKKNNKLSVECRVTDDNGICTDYILKDSDNRSHLVSIKEAWVLAVNKRIIGVTGSIYNKEKAIESVGTFRLSDVTTVKKSELS